MVADVGLELLEDGTPAYREVSLTVPRQSGKTTLILGWEVQRALGWDGPQRIVYSAQTGNDSRKKLVEDQFPLLDRHRKAFGIRQLLRGMGNEGVSWVNGSRLVVLASSEDSGHGKTVDLAVKDEFFADVDDRRDQALIPAMSTRPFAQILTASTAGTEASLPLNRLMAKGREAVDAGRREGVAYFEWSADPSDDIESPLVWARCMPALGYTISEPVVHHAFSTLTRSEFMRAFLNITTATVHEKPWQPGVWERCVGDAAPSGGLCLAVDATPLEPGKVQSCSIGVAGGGVVELVEPRPSMASLASDVVAVARSTGAAVALDPGGPAGFVKPALEAAGVTVVDVSGQRMGQACALFFDDVAAGRVRVRRNGELERAVAGAQVYPKGDAWVWARRHTSADVSPLVAVTLAWWAAAQVVPSDVFDGSFLDLDDFV